MADEINIAVRAGDIEKIKQIFGENKTGGDCFFNLLKIQLEDFNILAFKEQNPYYEYIGIRAFPLEHNAYHYEKNNLIPGYTKYRRIPAVGTSELILNYINELREKNGLPIIDKDILKKTTVDLIFIDTFHLSIENITSRGDLIGFKKYLKKQSIDLNKAYFFQYSKKTDFVFKLAIESGNLELIKYIKINYKVNVESQVSVFEDTALSIAVKNKDEDIIEYLLNSKANPNVKLKQKRDILLCAVCQENIITVKLLLKFGAKVKVNHLINAVFKGNCELFEILAADNLPLLQAKLIEDYTHFAVKSNNLKMLKLLIEKYNLDIEKTTNLSDSFICDDSPKGYGILRVAASVGNVEIMKYLVNDKKLPLPHYIIDESISHLPLQFDDEKTILELAVASSFNKKNKITKSKLPLLMYLFEDLKLVPNKATLEKLKKSITKNDLKVYSYIESYISDSFTEKYLLSIIVKKGITKVPLSGLFDLYKEKFDFRPKYRKDFLNKIEDALYVIIKENYNKIDTIINVQYIPEVLTIIYLREDLAGLAMACERGIDLNSQNHAGNTLAHNIVQLKNYEQLIKLLLHFNLQFDLPNKRKYTAINYMSINCYKDEEINIVLKKTQKYANTLQAAMVKNLDSRSIKLIINIFGQKLEKINFISIFKDLLFADENGRLSEINYQKVVQVLACLPEKKMYEAEKVLSSSSFLSCLNSRELHMLEPIAKAVSSARIFSSLPSFIPMFQYSREFQNIYSLDSVDETSSNTFQSRESDGSMEPSDTFTIN